MKRQRSGWRKQWSREGQRRREMQTRSQGVRENENGGTCVMPARTQPAKKRCFARQKNGQGSEPRGAKTDEDRMAQLESRWATLGGEPPFTESKMLDRFQTWSQFQKRWTNGKSHGGKNTYGDITPNREGWPGREQTGGAK
jgi:hypothetical protein